jgi:hypothetical protein
MPLCDACVKAKMTKRRLYLIEPKRPPVVGAYMSTDIKRSSSGERLYQGFLCGASKFLVAKCFEFKSASPRNLKSVLLKAPILEKLTQYHVDGAPELISKEIVQMLLKTGATASYSAPLFPFRSPRLHCPQLSPAGVGPVSCLPYSQLASSLVSFWSLGCSLLVCPPQGRPPGCSRYFGYFPVGRGSSPRAL